MDPAELLPEGARVFPVPQTLEVDVGFTSGHLTGFHRRVELGSSVPGADSAHAGLEALIVRGRTQPRSLSLCDPPVSTIRSSPPSTFSRLVRRGLSRISLIPCSIQPRRLPAPLDATIPRNMARSLRRTTPVSRTAAA